VPATSGPDVARVAVVIPCLNEDRTIAKVIADVRAELPAAEIWVIDNASTDATADRAREAGAIVITETRRGKGFAVRSAFRQIHADVYVMIEGDDTYPASALQVLLDPVLAGQADMVVGSRTSKSSTSEFRPLKSARKRGVRRRRPRVSGSAADRRPLRIARHEPGLRGRRSPALLPASRSKSS
jgi:glycosyltransferase involved in cell wall biosynthesis